MNRHGMQQMHHTIVFTQDVTIVRVRLPWAYAGAASVVAAAAVPPSADVFRNERRSISVIPPRNSDCPSQLGLDGSIQVATA